MSEYENAYGNPDVQLYQEPERTSILAILSLVFGTLGCCLGITSILGVPMAVASIFGISRSKGRVGGMGLAIGGLIIGLLTLFFWGAVIVGGAGALNVAVKQFGSTTETILTDIRNGDFETVRKNLAPPANAVSDEDLVDFAASYTADLGQYIAMPTNLVDLAKGYVSVAERIQPYQNRNGFVPMPAQFDSGWVLVIYVIDTTGNAPLGPNGMPLPEGLILIGSDGTEYSIPPGSSASSWPSAPPAAPAVPDSGSDADIGGESATSPPDNAEEEDSQDPAEGP